mmetsp:Transcript_26213/g.57403  ORF Transcript_26213/g.57403 Transcript_26213/m.57403 type:complete len:222 (+) Transcript_26213:190-855(+)
MKFTAAALLILSAVASAEEAVKAEETPKKPIGRMNVTLYGGPKDCTDDEKVKKGQYLTMHYVGTIDETSATGEKGQKFDSSRDRDDPFKLQIGVGQVIKGFDTGLVGLCKGAKAYLTIPPQMAYGDQGAGGVIPPGATLNFDIEIIDIADVPHPMPNIFTEIDTDGDKKLTKEEVEAFFKAKREEGIPDGLWESEDKDGDGFISWEEFGGSKGESPGGDEL